MLPLQIFEPRYTQMLRDAIEADGRFGVTLIRSGDEVGGPADPFETGTVARIIKLGETRANAIPLVTLGETRFRIESLDRVSKPYLLGRVDILLDLPEDAAEESTIEAARAAAERYMNSVMTTEGLWEATLGIPQAPAALSYFIGSVAITVPLRTRQILLETDGVEARLQAGIAMLEEESAQIERQMQRRSSRWRGRLNLN